jgi:hypothetical protein
MADARLISIKKPPPSSINYGYLWRYPMTTLSNYQKTHDASAEEASTQTTLAIGALTVAVVFAILFFASAP